MKTTRTNDTAKRMPGKRSWAISLLGAAGWLSLALGVLLFSFGAWKHYNAATAPITATYQDESVYVTASFGADAQIPKEAVLRAVAVTPEADPDAYSREMAAAMAAMGRDGETAPTNAIYNLGFFVGEQEVQPAAPVDVTVQLLRDGFAVGEPIQVVHFGEQAVEVIADTAVDEAGCVTFTAGGFSDFVFVLGTPTTIANGTNLNEGGFIEFAQLVDSNGKEPEDGKIELGKKYTYTVKFAENGANQFTSPMTFQLPDGFLATGVKDLPIVAEDGTQIGTYSVDEETGIVTFNVDPTYLSTHEDAWFRASFNMTAVGTKDGNSVSFPWSDSNEHQFDITGNPKVDLSKAAGEYDPVKHTIKYKVSMEVQKGAILDPKILDQMEQGMSLVDGTFTLKLYDEYGNEIVLDPPATAKKTENGWVTENLPEALTEGQKIEIEYEVAVEFDNEDANKNVKFDEGEDRYHFTLDNTAKLECSTPSGVDKVEGKTEATEKKTVDDLQLKKKGTPGSGDTIDWEISVGSGAFDVRGSKLTDTIGEGQWVDTTQPLEIKWKNGNGTMKTKKIEWQFKDGQIDKSAMEAAGVTDIVVDDQGRITGFNVTIPGKDDLFWTGKMDWQPEGHAVAWEPGDWVKVEYFTKHDPVEQGKSKNFTNKVSGLTEALPEGVVGEIVIGSGGIQKLLTNDVYTDTEDYVEYTITVKVPPEEELRRMTDSEGQEAGPSYDDTEWPYFYIRDQLEFPKEHVTFYDENGNIVQNRFFVNNIPEITNFQAFDSNNQPLTFVEVKDPVYNGDTSYYSYTVVQTAKGDTEKDVREFCIWFNTNFNTKDQGNYHNSLWPFNEEVTLNITYRVPGDSKLVKELDDGKTYVETDYTLRQLLEAGNRLDNEVWGKFDNDDGRELKSEDKYSKITPTPSINKLAELKNGNEIEYRVRFDNVFKNAEGTEITINDFSESQVESFVFMDQFDDKMEYVTGSMQVLVFDIDGGLRGYFKVKDQNSIEFVTENHKTTMTVEAKDFNDAHNVKDSTSSGIYNLSSLYEWLKTYQSSASGNKPKDSRYVFQYTLRIKNEYLQAEDLTLDNTAHIKYEGQDLSDSEKIKTSPDIVDKFAKLLTDAAGNAINEAVYTIVVNPGAANMAVGTSEGGGTHDLQTYSIKDEMLKGMSIDWSTIKVVGSHFDENGEEISDGELTWVDDPSQVSLGSKTFTATPTENGMELLVPDEIKLTITYNVTLDRKVLGERPHGVNTVTLFGDAEFGETEDTYFDVKIDKVDAGASDNIWLLKKDEQSNKFIDGAEFALYTKQKSSLLSDALDITPTDGDESTTLYKTGDTYRPTAERDPSTNRMGVSIKKPEGAKDDDYYVLVETKAPDGYTLDSTPLVFKYGKAPDEPEQVTVRMKVGDSYKDFTVTVVYYSSGENVIVDNTPNAYVLPESGGNGLSAVLAGGLALILLSGLAMFLIKRRRAN